MKACRLFIKTIASGISGEVITMILSGLDLEILMKKEKFPTNPQLSNQNDWQHIGLRDTSQ